MGDYYNEELRHRQRTGDVGNAVLGSARGGVSRKAKMRAFSFPLALIVVGVILVYWGPVPGLGGLMVLGGILGLPMVALSVLLRN